MKHKLFTVVTTLTLVLAMASTAFASTDSDIDTNNTTDTSVETAAQAVVEPSNLTAKSTKKGTIIVNWTASDNAVAYDLYRATNVNGKYKLVKSTTGLKFTDKKIHPKKTYFYKVVAKYAQGTKAVASTTSNIVSAKLKIKKSFKVTARAYSGGGRTKTGQKAKVGRIAVDPKVIKLGTWLYVEGYGMCQASDIGSKIKGKKIDVYKKTNKQCRKWGVKKPKIYIIG